MNKYLFSFIYQILDVQIIESVGGFNKKSRPIYYRYMIIYLFTYLKFFMPSYIYNLILEIVYFINHKIKPIVHVDGVEFQLFFGTC